MALLVPRCSCGTALADPGCPLAELRALRPPPGGLSALWLACQAGLALAVVPQALAQRRRRKPRSRVARRDAISAHGLPTPETAGLEAWRCLPGERVPNFKKVLRDAQNDLVREELDPTPIRTVAILPLPVDLMPCVGQVRQLELPAQGARRSVVLHACAQHGGFVACVVEAPEAQVLPRGAVGAEVRSIAPQADGSVAVTLCGVASLRLISRTAKASGAPPIIATLVQEVREWTDFEDGSGGAARVLDELQRLQDLFRACGQLQVRTGIWAAGDLASRTLDELTAAALEAVEGVSFSGLAGEPGDCPRAGAQRRAVLAAHAAVSALRGGKQATFLCDPCSVLRRLKALNMFLGVMERVLRGRL